MFCTKSSFFLCNAIRLRGHCRHVMLSGFSKYVSRKREKKRVGIMKGDG